MKTCSTCKSEKQLSEFHFKNSENRYQSICKKCFSNYCMERWTNTKRKAIEYKGGKCQNCGYSKYFGALEFHHINSSEKDYTWDKLRLKSWDKITKELDKCICLCANCHRETHAK